MLYRDNFEKNCRRLFSEYRYGSTIWSPLAGGILTGKYNDGNVPAGSRYDNHKHPVVQDLWQILMGEKNKDNTLRKLRALAAIASDLGYTQA